MTEEQETQQAAATLGIERWVQFAFLALGVLSFWLFDKVVTSAWTLLAESFPSVPEPESNYVLPIALLVAVAIAVGGFKHQKTQRYAHEVAGELTRVTWPNRQETIKQTGIVLAVSIAAALVLGLFDLVWANLTDVIY
jgi:preprotein translocase subunit SecE